MSMDTLNGMHKRWESERVETYRTTTTKFCGTEDNDARQKCESWEKAKFNKSCIQIYLKMTDGWYTCNLQHDVAREVSDSIQHESLAWISLLGAQQGALTCRLGCLLIWLIMYATRAWRTWHALQWEVKDLILLGNNYAPPMYHVLDMPSCVHYCKGRRTQTLFVDSMYWNRCKLSWSLNEVKQPTFLHLIV